MLKLPFLGKPIFVLYQPEQEGEEDLTSFLAKEPTREMACQLQANMEVDKEAEKRLVLSLAITWPCNELLNGQKQN